MVVVVMGSTILGLLAVGTVGDGTIGVGTIGVGTDGATLIMDMDTAGEDSTALGTLLIMGMDTVMDIDTDMVFMGTDMDMVIIDMVTEVMHITEVEGGITTIIPSQETVL